MENSQYKTIVVNLFAGPGAGKSTGAAYIFAKLKMLGIDAELVTEFAKDLVWENNRDGINNQLYVFGTQSFRMSRCRGKVLVIVTDSPLIINGLYCKRTETYYELLQKIVLEEWNKYDNHNYFVRRLKPYNSNGRLQNETEAVEIDNTILDSLETNQIEYTIIDGIQQGYDFIVENILKVINK